MGRKTKLTPEVSEKIVKLIGFGNYRETACAAAGIDARTLRNWLKWGAEGTEPYAAFCEAMEEAEAQAHTRHVLTLVSASKEDWRAAAWILSRRWPNQWAENRVLTAQSEGSGNVTVTVTPTPQAADRIAAAEDD